MAEWLVLETQSCKVADLNPIRAEFLLIRSFFLIFLISLDRAASWSFSRKCLRSATLPLCRILLVEMYFILNFTRKKTYVTYESTAFACKSKRHVLSARFSPR